MSAKDLFHQMMRERRSFQIGSPDWEWRTRTARKYLNITRGIPASQWSAQ